MPTVKEELTRLIQGQPDDSSREEIVRELAFHVMVERGLADSDAKRTISNEEMAHRIRSWQQWRGPMKIGADSKISSSISLPIIHTPPLAPFKKSTSERKSSPLFRRSDTVTLPLRETSEFCYTGITELPTS